MTAGTRLRILTDGKAGDVQQCRGVAIRLAELRPVTTTEHIVGAPAATEPTDIVLASGRHAVRAARGFAPRAFLAYLKRPRFPQSLFVRPDFVWQPAHDGSANNAFTTLTAPHPFTPARLRDNRVGPLHGTTIVLGGDSGSASWSADDLRTIAADIAALPGPYRLVRSRRTTAALLRAMPTTETFDDYPRALADAVRIVVTGDSHNMVSEALACGVPVHVARPSKLAAKFSRFLDTLEAEGLVNRLGASERPSPGPVDATPAIAAELDRAFTRWKGDPN